MFVADSEAGSFRAAGAGASLAFVLLWHGSRLALIVSVTQDLSRRQEECLSVLDFFHLLFPTANAGSVEALVERLKQRHESRPADALSDAQRAELREASWTGRC